MRKTFERDLRVKTVTVSRVFAVYVCSAGYKTINNKTIKYFIFLLVL
jgi:hypothetical protein